ncbi:MAG: PP2C family protein-serine/threonine phosphatase [Dehalococcoidia bacterium]
MPTGTSFNIQKGRFAVGGSRQGPKHRENEDSFRLAEPPPQRGGRGNLYVVADGVGGHRKGEVASALAVDVIQRAYFAGKGGDAAANLIAAIGEANLRVHESAGSDNDEGPSMATTVVAAAVLDEQIVVANVGDSRAYIVGDGAIRQLSHDHSWVQDQIDSGHITPEEARTSPRRNIITRALGLDRQVQTDVKTETDTATHTRLVLCSDGVHGVVEDDELAQLIEGVEPETAVEKVLALVDSRGGKDDATVIVVEVFNRVTSDVAIEAPKVEASFFPKVFHFFRKRR